MKQCNSQSLRDAAFTYSSMGYKILSLEPRDKKATSLGWSDPEYFDSPIHWESKGNENNNIGMPLGRNHFFVIDIDNKPEYVKSMKVIEDSLVELTGVDKMFWESPTIGISSGKPNSEKYMFKVPADMGKIRFHKINWTNSEKKSHTVVEFRCGDGFQDVMPPSIHPTGTTYQFTNGDFALDMPLDLQMLVENWSCFAPIMMEVNPDYVKPVRVCSRSGKPYEGDDYVQMWCDKEYLPSWLTKYGYKHVSGNRYLSPHSTTQSPGIVVFDNGKKFYSHGESDPLSDGCPHSAYDLLAYYEYNNNYKEAWKFILKDLGVKRARNLNRTPQWS